MLAGEIRLVDGKPRTQLALDDPLPEPFVYHGLLVTVHWMPLYRKYAKIII
jgi:hypothetical protein